MGIAAENGTEALKIPSGGEFKGRIYLYGDKIKIVSKRSCSAPPKPRSFDDLGDDEQRLDFFKDDLRKIDGRFLSSLSRSRSAVFEIACCNEWEWFCTLTLDPKKFDRSDLPTFQKALAQWLRDRRKATGFPYMFLLVPELHADGKNWHMHGLLSGIPPFEICSFSSDAPIDLRKGDYKNWYRYERKFGFCSLGKIRDRERVASYISKYVTKDFGAAAMKFGGHLYYASKGLRRRITLFDGTFEMPDGWEFENEYVRIKWMEGADLMRALGWLKNGRCAGLGSVKDGVITDGEFAGCFCSDMEQMFLNAGTAEKVKTASAPQGKP